METRQTLKDRALASLKGKWGTGALATLVYLIVAVGVSFIPMVSMVSQLVTIPLGWGFSVLFLSIARQQQVGVGNLFDGFSDYGRVFFTQLLVGIYTFLWALLLIVPGIIKGYSYALTPYILRDEPELKYNAAIERSMQMMQGHKMELFLLHLSFLGWWLLCILTLGIGLLWLSPYQSTTQAHFYEVLRAEQTMEA